MTPDLAPSRTLLNAMRRELGRLDRARQILVKRRSKLEAELRDIEGKLTELDERVRQLQAAAGVETTDLAPEPDRVADSDPKVLRGAEIRERAARRVFLSVGASEALHYRRWLALLLEDGFEITGKDPAATFLTNLTRSPVVKRGPEPAMYQIDSDAPDRLRVQLAELEAELRDLTKVLARGRADEPRLRDHRDRLVSDIRRLEGLIAEADRVLAPVGDEGRDDTMPAAA